MDPHIDFVVAVPARYAASRLPGLLHNRAYRKWRDRMQRGP